MCGNILNAGEWLNNYNQALALAKTENKPILVDFTGSDWCVWCMKLKSDVFSQPEFQSWAKDNVVLLELDFPRQIPQDEATKQANDGFPTVVLLNPDGGEKARTGYRKGGAVAYIQYLKQLLQ